MCVSLGVFPALDHCPVGSAWRFPASRWPVVPLSRWPSVPLARWPGVPLARCPVVPLSRCPVGPVSRWPVGPLSRWPGVPLSRCPVGPVSRCPVVPLSRGRWRASSRILARKSRVFCVWIYASMYIYIYTPFYYGGAPAQKKTLCGFAKQFLSIVSQWYMQSKCQISPVFVFPIMHFPACNCSIFLRRYFQETVRIQSSNICPTIQVCYK